MRILHVYRTYFPDTQGGLEEAIRQICRSTSRYGVHNTVFTLSDRPRPSEIAFEEANVIRVRKAFEIASCGFATPSGVARFRQEAKAHDLIHYHFPWPFADMMHLGCRVQRPAVATYHSDVVRQRLLGAAYRPLMHRFLAGMQRVVATSPQYARTSEVLASLAQGVSVIPLTIDPASYAAPESVRMSRWRQRLGESYFAFVGVLRYYKGLDWLIAAARQTGLVVAIAGEGPDGRRLRRLATGLGNVAFLGRIDDADKVALIAAARAVVFPSHLRSEAFGMTLLEGAMSARPLVSCEIGTGTSFVNVDGQTGFVVPPEDTEALAGALRVLADDPARADRLGRQARRRFEDLFSSRAVGRAYSALYADALAAPARRL